MVTQQFHETLEPLSEWLTATEKHLVHSEPIGTETSKLEDQISQHKVTPIVSIFLGFFFNHLCSVAITCITHCLLIYVLFIALSALYYFPSCFSLKFCFCFMCVCFLFVSFILGSSHIPPWSGLRGGDNESQ